MFHKGNDLIVYLAKRRMTVINYFRKEFCQKMITFPNAKINLGLNVLEKRPDGFHNIETVFYPVDWCDMLEIIKLPAANTGKVDFTLSGIPVAGDYKNNLSFKAFELLDKDFNLGPFQLFLHKIIPMGAGLGGGSSDAAFTLKLINELFELNLGIDQLLNYASQLGSDCCFFILNQPVFAEGRGELLKKINLNLKGKSILIIQPDVSVSTGEAYQSVIPSIPEKGLNEIIELPISQWKTHLKNDFEKSVFAKYPVIEEVKNRLYKAGAVYASMSGSGSAVFGIFESDIPSISEFNNYIVYNGMLK